MNASSFDKIDLNSLVVGSVWMTVSGYPAIISEVISSKITGLVVSPSGTVQSSWDEEGHNEVGLPSFHDLKYPPGLIAHKYAILKKGQLIGSDSDVESAKKMGDQNGADIVCKYSELYAKLVSSHADGAV